MKQGLNSSTTRAYPTQLVVARASLIALRLPNYTWIVMVLLAMALLATAAIYRERGGLRTAQASFQRTQQKYQDAQFSTELLRQDLQAAQQNKSVITRAAQTKLNYVRRNEIVVVVR